MFRRKRRNEGKEAERTWRAWLEIPVEGEAYQPPAHGVILLQVLIVLLFFLFVLRFWYLQVHMGADMSRQALANRLRYEQIYAPRGRILDTNGLPLADNRIAFGLSLVREDCHDIPATLAQVAAWTGIPLDKLRDRFQHDRQRTRPFEPILLTSDMDFALASRVEAELVFWPGLEIVVRSKRWYPEKELFAHVLGYVAEANEKELDADPELALGDLVGKQGLEYSYEKLQMALHDRHVRRWFATGIAGMSVVADSLSAIKYGRVKVVRDETGFIVDYIAQNDFPKYGNDDDRVDSIAQEVLHTFISYIRENATYRESIATTSVLTITSNVVYGKNTGSTPDGRLKGKAFAPGANPMHGRDSHGAVASLSSVAKLPFLDSQDGISNTFSIIPGALGKDDTVIAGDLDIDLGLDN